MKKTAAWWTLLYGISLIALGYIGYVQAHSTASLRMGTIFGLLILISAAAMFKRKAWGLYGALIFTFFLMTSFAYRYSVTGRTVPAVLAVLSGAMLLYLLTQLVKRKKY